MNARTRLALSLALIVMPASSVLAAGLGGSKSSMRRQHAVAVASYFTFAATRAQLDELVREDRLQAVYSTADLLLDRVSFPYARPAVRLFVERIAAEYRAATGERLVVTSLTRPLDDQPRNASPLSVHPAGMAVDFRRPSKASSRQWLEKTLLSLESKGVIDATRERKPPHYHVAVFSDKYATYALTLGATIPAASAIDNLVPSLDPRTIASAPAHVERAVPVMHGGSALPLLVAFGLVGLAGFAMVAASRRLRRA